MKKKVRRVIISMVERFPRIAQTARTWRAQSVLSTTPALTPYGFKFVGNPLMVKGNYEVLETRLVLHLLGSYEVFINAGANIGYYCCLALQARRQTLAFEPIRSNLDFLYKNIEINGWMDNIEVHPVALGNTIGLTKIYGGDTGASLVEGWAGIAKTYHTTVPISKLDTVLAHRFSENSCLVLVDIEGAEYLLLQGAQEFLKRKNVTWIVEISTAENQPAGVKVNPNLKNTFELFWEHGLVAHAIRPQYPVITPEIVAEMCNTGKPHFPTHNYLFTHPDFPLASLPAYNKS